MISTHLTADLIGRLEDDFKFKKENIKHIVLNLVGAWSLDKGSVDTRRPSIAHT